MVLNDILWSFFYLRVNEWLVAMFDGDIWRVVLEMGWNELYLMFLGSFYGLLNVFKNYCFFFKLKSNFSFFNLI
jgi:hypothetical protein